MGEKEKEENKMEIEIVRDDSEGDVEVIKLIRDDGAVLTFLINLEKDPDELMAIEFHGRDRQVLSPYGGYTDVGKLRVFFSTTR